MRLKDPASNIGNGGRNFLYPLCVLGRYLSSSCVPLWSQSPLRGYIYGNYFGERAFSPTCRRSFGELRTIPLDVHLTPCLRCRLLHPDEPIVFIPQDDFVLRNAALGTIDDRKSRTCVQLRYTAEEGCEQSIIICALTPAKVTPQRHQPQW